MKHKNSDPAKQTFPRIFPPLPPIPYPPGYTPSSVDCLTLPEGNVSLSCPKTMSRESAELVCDWIDLMVRKMRLAIKPEHSAVSAPATEPTQPLALQILPPTNHSEESGTKATPEQSQACSIKEEE